tara:strand:- start:568 stop:702 length:135 start_codon:yes stop_codon:yes gene_type:complete
VSGAAASVYQQMRSIQEAVAGHAKLVVALMDGDLEHQIPDSLQY